MIQDVINDLAEKISQNPPEMKGHNAIILSDFEGCGCAVYGDIIEIGNLIGEVMFKDKDFADIIIACGRAYLDMGADNVKREWETNKSKNQS